LRESHLTVIVTHNMQQALGISERIAFFAMSVILEPTRADPANVEPGTRVLFEAHS